MVFPDPTCKIASACTLGSHRNTGMDPLPFPALEEIVPDYKKCQSVWHFHSPPPTTHVPTRRSKGDGESRPHLVNLTSF